jgi:hypothetical protein
MSITIGLLKFIDQPRHVRVGQGSSLCGHTRLPRELVAMLQVPATRRFPTCNPIHTTHACLCHKLNKPLAGLSGCPKPARVGSSQLAPQNIFALLT